jgi:hypothetical protein
LRILGAHLAGIATVLLANGHSCRATGPARGALAIATSTCAALLTGDTALARTVNGLADRQPLGRAASGVRLTVTISRAAGLPTTCFRRRIATVVAAGCPVRAAERIAVRAAVAGPRAAAVDRAAFGTCGTALRAVPAARAERQAPGRAAKLFAVAGAMAAGVITALAVRAADSGRIAAGGAAFIRRAGRAGADAIDRNLFARTFDGGGRGRGTPRGAGIALRQHPSHRRRATQSNQPLEQRTPGRARHQRPRQLIEARTVHRCPHGS